MGYLVVSVVGIILLGFVLPVAIAVWWIGPSSQERPTFVLSRSHKPIRSEER